MKNSHIKHEKDGYTFYEVRSSFTLVNTVVIQYSSGSSADPEDQVGIAHLTEHLLTHQRDNKISSYLEMESENIQIQAYTYKEKTMYFVSSREKKSDKLVHKMVDMLTAKINLDVLNKEKQTVISEISTTSHNRYNKIYELALRKCSDITSKAKNHAREIVGTVESVKKINIKDISVFLEKNYTNPQVVVSSIQPLSEIEVSNIFKLLNKLNYVAEKKSKIDNTSLHISDFSFLHENTQVLGFCIERPKTFLHDVYLGFLHEYLAGNWSSILNQELRIKKQLTYFANSEYHSYNEFALIFTYFDVDKKNKTLSKKILNSIVKKIKKGEFDSKICKATKNMRINKLHDIYRYEKDYISDFLDMISLQSTGNTFPVLADYIKNTDQITPSKLKEYISKFKFVSTD